MPVRGGPGGASATVSGPPLTGESAAASSPAPLRQADRVARDRAVGEELAHLVDGGVGEGQDELRRRDLVVRQGGARRLDERHGGAQGGTEHRVLVVADGRVEVLVERGQLRGGVVIDTELALAEDSHDHSPSPACCSAAAASWPAAAEPLPSICLGVVAAISFFNWASW